MSVPPLTLVAETDAVVMARPAHEALVVESKIKQEAYEASRRQWRLLHPHREIADFKDDE